MDFPNVTAILLAAGMSTRMKGKNKMVMSFEGKPLIQHVYDEIIEAGIGQVIVVGGRESEQVKDKLQLRDEDDYVFNPEYEQGITTSIQAGIKAASGKAFMICLGDMPNLKSMHYKAMVDLFNAQVGVDPKTIIQPLVNEQRGNPVIFSAHYRKTILKHKELNGCRSVIQNNIAHLSTLVSDQMAYLTDIDTPEDYRKLTHAVK